jgi:quercetin dioxygenase-like cupin family protein
MTTTFIDTNKLPRARMAQGEFTEILNGPLVGAKNVLGTLRWLEAGESFQAPANGKHQLLYLMEGSGVIGLEGKDYEVRKGSGVYLGPQDSASIRSSGGSLKLFHLEVPRIPQ